MIYFWSDTHFNHRGIMSHCSRTRPYSSVEEMNIALIAKWGRIRDSDTIYLLGDFGFRVGGGAKLADIFSSLPGHKHLIVGNHDEKNPEVLKLPWESVSHLKVVKDNGRRAVLCHYPLETWASAHHGVLHFHGHCHGTLRRKIPHRFDVGADVFTNGPVSWDELEVLAALEPYNPQDHHGEDM